MNGRDAQTGKPTFGASFLEHYERAGGSPAAFTFVQLQAIRAAGPRDLIDQLLRLQVVGLDHAELQTARGLDDPAQLAQVVLLKQRQGTRALLLAGGLAALGPLVALLAELSDLFGS